MRKFLLSYFLIFGVFVASAQIQAPKILEFPSKTTKTSFEVVLEPQGTGNVALFLEVTGPGITKPFTLTRPVSGINTFKVEVGLQPGTTYTVNARGIGCASEVGCATLGPWATTSITTQEGFPPAAVLKDVGSCPQFVGLNWTIPSGGGKVTNIIIKKSYGGPWYDVAHIPPYENTYYDLDVRPGIFTTYFIYTQNALGEISESNHVGVPVKSYVAPAAPVNLRVDNQATTRSTIRLRWENPEEDLVCKTNVRTSYYVMVKRPFESEYKVWGVTYPHSNTYDIEGLEENETVDIYIRARSDQEIWGDQAHIRAKTNGRSSKPTNVIGVAYLDNLKNSVLGISWTHPGDDADYYVVQYSLDGINFIPLTTNKVGVNQINHTNISEGQQYTYRVKAGNYVYGESDWVNMNGFVTCDYTSAPTAPYGLSAKWTGANVVLNWVDDTNKEEVYVIERSKTETGTYTEVGEVKRFITTFTNQLGTDTSTVYYYRVKAVNPKGASAPSKVVRASKTAAASGAVIGILAYPNPTVDRLSISVPSDLKAESVEVSVYNQGNQLVLSKKFDRDATLEVSLRKFTPGLYNVVIKSGDFQETKKIVKN